MKQKIRKNIFETNSSSTHSIVIGNNGEDVFADLPRMLEFRAGEFGWEHRLLNDTQSKADYLFTALVYTETPNKYMEFIKDTLEKWGVCVSFGDEIVERKYHDGTPYYDFKCEEGYIDHGDETADFVEGLFNDEILLMNYLFSDASFVETSNDNDNDDYEAWGKIPNNLLCEYYKGN